MSKKITRSILSSILLAAVASYSLAAQESGTIKPGWHIYSDGNVFFYLSGQKNNNSCTAIPDRWAFDTTTPLGKTFYSAFLTAFTTKREIKVVSSGGCTHGNTDTVTELFVN